MKCLVSSTEVDNQVTSLLDVDVKFMWPQDKINLKFWDDMLGVSLRPLRGAARCGDDS